MRTLAIAESLLRELLKENAEADLMAIHRLYTLISLLRKEHIHELEREAAAIRLAARYKRGA